MNTKPNLKAIIDNNLDKTGHIPSKGQSRLPKEGWLDSYKHGGSYASSWMLTNPKPAPVSFPRMQFAGPVSSQDSLRHQAGKMFNFEETKGSPTGTKLDDWGYHQSQMPWNTTPKNWKKPETPKQAVDLYMQEIATNPILGYFPSAMEKGEAGDFLYNSGRDARVYMLDQYLKSKGEAGLPNRGSYNVDTKTEKWTPELQQSLNEQWNNYSQEINKLPTNTRRQLLNKGRDFYYKNTYSADTPGVTYWSRSQEQKPGSVYDNQTGYWYHRGTDGSLSPAYDKTWKPRIWESVNTYENGGDISIPDLDANKWLMKYQDRGEVLLPKIGSKEYYQAADSKRITSDNTRAVPAQITGTRESVAEERKKELAERARKRKDPGTFSKGNYAIEESLRAFPESQGGIGELIDEYANPAYFIGRMASNLGNAGSKAYNTGDFSSLPGAIAEPLVAGALGLDPLGSAIKVPGRVAQSMESGLLSNTYKLNPWAFKANPNSAYRMLGDEAGLNNVIQSGYLKPSTKGSDIGIIHDETHFQIGAPSDKRKYYGSLWDRGYPGPYMAEVPNAVTDSRFSHIYSNFTPEEYKNLVKHLGENIGRKNIGDNVWTELENYIPTKEAKLYKQDWLKGYKEVPKSVPAKKKGGMITDPRGQWAHPGQNTRIPSNNITMDGVGYPVLAKASNGQQQMMYPGQNYYFPGASHVDEYPMMESGGWLNKHL